MRRRVELSVVIAASCSAEAVARTLASVLDGGATEIIVASDPTRIAPTPLPGRALWLIGEPGDGVPRLRAVGAAAARGSIVAFLEDACVVDRGWARAIREAFRNPDVLAATGPVAQTPGRSATDWAVYFAEYAGFARDRPGRDGLAGINFACRREALRSTEGATSPGWQGFAREPRGARVSQDRGCGRPQPLPPQVRDVAAIREFDLASRLAGSIRWNERMSIRHTRRYRFGEALADRWRFGRAFGRERWDGHPGRLRRLGLASAPAILGVQLARLGKTVAKHPELTGPLLRSAPSTLALLTAWSLGEALGWAESPGCGRAARPHASGPVPARMTRPRYRREPDPA